MFKNLIIKNIRDLRQNFSEFFSIFALSLLSLLVFSGLMAAGNGMDHQFNKWSQKSNIADEWVSVRNNHNLNKLSRKKDVHYLDKQFVFNTYYGSHNSKKMLQATVMNSNKVSKPNIISGQRFSKNVTGIWLDKNFAQSNKLKVGNNLKISLPTGLKQFKIKGLVESPNYIGYTGPMNDIVANHNKYGYLLTNEKTMPVFKNKTNQVLIRNKNNVSSNSVKKTISNVLGNSVISISNRNEYSNVSKYLDKSNSLKRISLMFCLILFLLVLLVTETTMGRLVGNQRNIIGLFRALGFKKVTVVFHYLFYGLTTTLFGGVIGLYLGPKTIAKLILNKQKPLYNMPFWSVHDNNSSWIILLILVGVSIFTSALAVMKILRGTPAQIMQDNDTSKTPRTLLEGFSILWNLLNWDWKWVLRDKSRSKSKELIGIIAVAGSLMLLIGSLGIQNSLSKTNEDTFGKVFQYKNEVKINPNATSNKINNLTANLNDDYQELEQIPVNVRTPKKQSVTSANIISKGIYVQLPTAHKNTVNLDRKNGAYITELTAKKLNINSGQNIEINSGVLNKKEIVPVIGVVKISTPQGIYLSKRSWQAMNQSFNPTSIYTSQNLTSKFRNKKEVEQINTLSDNIHQSNKVLSSFQSIIILMIVFSLFLAWFVLYNLGMLNFSERYREYATMRVLGFRLNEIRSIIIKDNLLTWFMGTILGIPLGLVFLNAYVQLANTDTSAFYMHIGFIRVCVAVGIILINVLVVALEVSRQVKKINMSTALKSVE